MDRTEEFRRASLVAADASHNPGAVLNFDTTKRVLENERSSP